MKGSGAQVDRFIPTRSAIDVDLASYKLWKENEGVGSPSASTPGKVSGKLTVGAALPVGKMRTHP